MASIWQAVKILVVIPAYEAAETLAELVTRLSGCLPRQQILIVDDGSSDRTFQVAQATGAGVIRHPINQGKGGALKTGFEYALKNGFEGVITLDADLQHDPSSVPGFMLAAQRGADVAVGTRVRNLANMPFDRFLTNHLTSLIISCFSGRFVRDSQSGYRFYSCRAIRLIRLSSSRYDFESEFLFKAGRAGFKVWEVAIPTIYSGSKSHINPLRDTGRFIGLMWKALFW